MKTVRVAMLGSGFVADFYMQGLANVNGQEVVVNYSRDAERAREFARKWVIPEPAGDLEAIIGRTTSISTSLRCRTKPICPCLSRCPKPAKTRYARNRWDVPGRRAS